MNINIDLAAIPKNLIRFVNGKAYINLNIGELREIDERGNDHFVTVYIPQEKRNLYAQKIYIGRGKEYRDEPQHTGGTKFPEREPAQPVNTETDLPF